MMIKVRYKNDDYEVLDDIISVDIKNNKMYVNKWMVPEYDQELRVINIERTEKITMIPD